MVRSFLSSGGDPGPGGLGAVCFHNRLKWARVMLLVLPAVHGTQEEMWTGPAIRPVAEMAVRMGEERCPEGFRLISNFGKDAHQSQEHGHVHVISGLTAAPPHAKSLAGQTAAPGTPEMQESRVATSRWAVRFSASGAGSQKEFWLGKEFTEAARAAVLMAKARSPGGFRLISNFAPRHVAPDGGEAGLFVLGGGQQELYV